MAQLIHDKQHSQYQKSTRNSYKLENWLASLQMTEVEK